MGASVSIGGLTWNQRSTPPPSLLRDMLGVGNELAALVANGYQAGATVSN